MTINNFGTRSLGIGDDRFTWDPGDGSDSFDGGAGNDTMTFNGSNASEKMSLSANGTRALFLRDVAAIRMDLNDVENLGAGITPFIAVHVDLTNAQV